MPHACVIFDFDGVIADTERLHLAAYNATLEKHRQEIGGPLEISPPAYFTRYIVYGNREGFWHILRDADRPPNRPHLALDDPLIATLCATKDQLFERELHKFAEPLPGVRQLLAWLEKRHIPRAICSGAARREILHLLQAFSLRHHFEFIVAIEDVITGKPDPEGYNKAFDLLNVKHDGELERSRSLVIEDSAGGCAAAKAAGIPVLGVATSLTLEEVQRCADFSAQNLEKINWPWLEEWFA